MGVIEHADVEPVVSSRLRQWRFRAGDLARHLDMVLVGELCLAVRVDGFIGLMDDFWLDSSGQLCGLIDALKTNSLSSVPRLAHSMKGSAAALGCVGLAAVLRSIELESASYSPSACERACASLLEHWYEGHALCLQAGFTRAKMLNFDN